MELLIQCVPAFLLAIHWPRFRARPGFLGLLAGSAIAVTGMALETKRLGGVHVGVIGLGVNGVIAILGSRLARRSDPVAAQRPGGVGGAT